VTNAGPDHRWGDAHLDAMRLVGDPLADDLVRPLLDSGAAGGVVPLMRALVADDDVVPAALPVDVRSFLDETSTLPDWVDHDRVGAGQAVFEEWGVEISTALFCASLPSAYASDKGVHVLAQTARLETDTRRRILETGQFLIDVMAPGGLGPSGRGIRSIQRVRLMHAAVRHLIIAHRDAVDPGDGPPRWNDAWGHPINQEDLAGTLMSFAYTVAEPLPRMGIVLSPQECEDYLYTWRVIGHQLGILDEMIPASIADATALVAAIRRRNFHPCDDGVLMTKALVELLDEMTPDRRLDGMVPDLIRMLVGDHTANLLGVPPSNRYYGLLALMRVWFRVSSHLAENHRVLRKVGRQVGWHVLNGMIVIERAGDRRASFDIPDQLARGWRLIPAAPTT
jgi:hypothetical protein